MKIVKPGFSIMDHGNNPLEHIEKIGRLCYKSEDKIADGTAEKFIKMLFNNKHHAMLEHYRFVVEVESDMYDDLLATENLKYLTMTCINSRLISGSARSFIDILMNDSCAEIHHHIKSIVRCIMTEYCCAELFGGEFLMVINTSQVIRVLTNKEVQMLSEEEYQHHGWMSVHFVCDRGVSHEIVRHRDASFAQESTRYCNYGGTDIQFIEPLFWDKRSNTADYSTPEWIEQRKYELWCDACMYAEDTYNELIEYGCQPQEARAVLPNSLKTEIVVTATMQEWKHIFRLRALGETGKPHPQMVEVMMPLYTEYMLMHMERVALLDD